VSTEGIWITAGWDLKWYDVVPHETAEQALEYLSHNQGYYVRFVPWGTELEL